MCLRCIYIQHDISDKYLAILKLGTDQYRLIVTTYRSDLPNVLSFNFDIDLPSELTKMLFHLPSPIPPLLGSDGFWEVVIHSHLLVCFREHYCSGETSGSV